MTWSFIRTPFPIAALLLAAAGQLTNGRPPEPAHADRGSAAFLFVYRLKPGLEAQFEHAYRRHLEWHRRERDPLPWYGWVISGGDRLGFFVDGTFGVPFAALDRRVKPREDREDFERTAGAFAEAVERTAYRLRRDLSTATPIEDGTPDPAMEVLDVLVEPGAERVFEEALAHARTQAGTTDGSRVRYTCYQLVAGGELPRYLITIGRSGWDLYDGTDGSALDLVFGVERAAARREIEKIRDSVVRVRSETWTYRPDLTLVPDTAASDR